MFVQLVQRLPGMLSPQTSLAVFVQKLCKRNWKQLPCLMLRATGAQWQGLDLPHTENEENFFQFEMVLGVL